MSNIIKILSTADVTKKISVIAKSGKTFQNAVQVAAVSIMHHMSNSRDKTLLSGLYDAMPNGARRKTMVDWFNNHAAGAVMCTYGKDGLKIELADIKSDVWTTFAATIDTVVSDMSETNWHEYAKEKGEQDKLTVDAVLKYLARKANAKDVDAATLAALKLISESAAQIAKDAGLDKSEEK